MMFGERIACDFSYDLSAESLGLVVVGMKTRAEPLVNPDLAAGPNG